MAWKLDPEVAQALAPVFEAMAQVTPPPVGDVASRRAGVEGLLGKFFGAIPATNDVSDEPHTARSADGFEVPMRLFRASGSTGGPLAVYAHGGGMILGSVELYAPHLRYLVSRSGVDLLAVDYRLAPEHPHPSPVEDCFAGLQWAATEGQKLGYDPTRLAIAGDSAGGNLAAATALLARDRGGPALARQILVYPMLDDRNTTAPELAPEVMTWTYDDNVTGWGALLGDIVGTDAVPAYAAPARATELSDLPATNMVVGDMDIFRDEDIAYAARLSAAGVPVEFHLVPGAPHAFDFFAPNSAIGRRAYDDLIRAYQSI